MGKVIQILNPDFNSLLEQRSRQWLALGDSVSVGRFVLTVERVWEAGNTKVVMVAYALDCDRVERLNVPFVFNFAALGVPVVAAPKALEFDAMGRPERVLFEFCGVVCGDRDLAV